MSSPVVTIKEDEPVNKVAQLMNKHDIGCVIVAAEDEKPIGVITERDLAERVVANDARPSKVIAREIMSAPLVTIDPEGTITEAARRMSLQGVRRLVVRHRGALAGIVSSKDILAVTPELMETIQERARIENQNLVEEMEEAPPSTGYCDNCRVWADDLREVEGSFLCEECRLEVARSEY
ncbi:MAG: CBS domain-containing protein [Candidatus Bathyarchaeota archaeon]|nr:CBS domain-containing protein [Candidatus Bathyarchaeota archaeon]